MDRRWRRAPQGCVGVLSTLLLGLVLLPGTAAARGVAVDVGRIDVDETLVPGASYVLPSIGVRNPGTEPATYTLGVAAVRTDRLAVPEEWVAFAPDRITLDPDRRQRVEPTLHIPFDAPAGDYEALLAARLEAEGDGARVGAAAASRLTFSVSPIGEPADASGFGVVRGAGWLLMFLVVAAVLAAGRWLAGFRIQIERR
jgi:hypothetical protein